MSEKILKQLVDEVQGLKVLVDEVQDLKIGFGELRADVAELKTDVGDLKTVVKENTYAIEANRVEIMKNRKEIEANNTDIKRAIQWVHQNGILIEEINYRSKAFREDDGALHSRMSKTEDNVNELTQEVYIMRSDVARHEEKFASI